MLHNLTLNGTLDGLDFTILKVPFTRKTRSWHSILSMDQNATRFTSIWFVKQEDFCGTKELRINMTEV